MEQQVDIKSKPKYYKEPPNFEKDPATANTQQYSACLAGEYLGSVKKSGSMASKEMSSASQTYQS